ncbi:hypothetical protein CH299_29000 [Rhodococcus sp. 14-2686-1-2]|nr:MULTISPECIES: DUF4192 domain-containing protein [unclassified Rhodococcus (in: high G+C Gram-positive bacteria)]OZE92947.1 hypothetical protein CH301_28485 [Rhodococcus sp. 15-1189-1-1a]OZF08201.1 hypothetical protein CH299_29000 [Rhodococcus sp. 14-2686-1-2]
MTQHRISIPTAADTLAAIPALLGFTPENSVVVIALAKNAAGAHVIAATARHDADDTERIAPDLAAGLARQDIDGNPVTVVILIAVADAAHSGRALIALDAVRAAFAAHDIHTGRALHTWALTPGTIYTDLDRGTSGVLPDPALSELATAEAIEHGRTISARREDIAARFEQGDEIPESVGLAAAKTMGEDFLPVTFDELAAVIHARETPSADLTARVGLALATGHLEVRDAFLAMAVHGHQDAADTFTIIATRLRGTARAQALTLAAFFLYCTGNGGAASIAIEAVEAAATASGTDIPSLTALISRAMRAGMPPKQVATIADEITPDYIATHIGRVQSYR